MKIYFCDECNESIPLQDIKDNNAVTLKGKIYCQNCNPLKEVAYEKGHARSAGLSNGLLFLVAALLVLHQDDLFFGFWRDSKLVFGFMPKTLLYHAGISVAAGFTWFLATRFAWPKKLEQPASPSHEGGGQG